MSLVDDLNRDLLTDRLAGRNSADTTLPPLQRGSLRIPTVTNITINGPTKGAFGDLYQLSWVNPVDLNQVSYYIIHLFRSASQLSFATQIVYSSPCFISIPLEKADVVVVKIQPILRSGLSPDISTCGATSVTSSASPLAISSLGLFLDSTSQTNGQATLSSGSIVVTTNKVTSISRIFLSRQTEGSSPGHLSITSITSSTSFTITSTDPSDDGVVSWLLFN